MLDEEDESGGGRSWMTRLIPGKIFKINYLIHPIVAGLVFIHYPRWIIHLYNKALRSYIYIYIYPFLSVFKFHGQRRVLQSSTGVL